MPWNLMGQYDFLGDANRIKNQCYQLTPETMIGYGQIIRRSTHNLNNPLTLYTEMYFGDSPEGGNGIVFFMQESNDLDIQADSIYGLGVNVSGLQIEFDTYQDSTLNDPVFDHVCLFRDGGFNHNSLLNLQGPVLANILGNLADDTWHSVKIEWNPNNQIISVLLDCQEVINYEVNLIDELFGGNPNVYFGFSGGSTNTINNMEVCIDISSQTDLLSDVTICDGAKTQINSIVGAAAYRWTPSEGLSADNIANPVAAPEESTTYLLEVETGYCNEVLNYSVDVNVSDLEANIDLGADTSLCIPETYELNASSTSAFSYRWSNGIRDSVNTINRSGRFDVTVTYEDGCIAEDWVRLEFKDVPSVSLGNDTTICFNSQAFSLKPIVNDTEVIYLWSNGSVADSLQVSRAGLYMVSVENNCGSNETQVFVYSENCRDFYMPNVFSPNADGFNDEMYPYTENGDIDLISHFSIYDRWGSLVHLVENGKPNDRSLGWNGKSNGRLASEGIYVYKLILRFRDGQELLVKGDFTLVR